MFVSPNLRIMGSFRKFTQVEETINTVGQQRRQSQCLRINNNLRSVCNNILKTKPGPSGFHLLGVNVKNQDSLSLQGTSKEVVMVKRYMSSHASRTSRFSSRAPGVVWSVAFCQNPIHNSSFFPCHRRSLLPLELPDLIHKIVRGFVGDDLLKGGFTIACKGARTMDSTDVDKF
jgi:hypothetical protein